MANVIVDIRPLMERHRTGVSVYTENTLRSVLERDQKNKYFLFYNSFKSPADLPKFNRSDVFYCGFRYPNKILNLTMRFLGWPKVDKMVGKKFHIKADVFWMPNWQFIALSKNIKKILTVHDLSPLLYPDFFSLKRRLWHKLINTPKLCRTFDRLIAVSENTKNDLIKTLGLSEEKVTVVYPGTNSQLETHNLKLETIKTKYNLPDKFILYLGTLEPRKNIIGIITAFEKLINCRLPVAGCQLILAGPRGWLYEDIYRAAKQSPVADKIRFINYVAEDDKPTFYAAAELFIFPSFYEGFGFPPLEAMAAGTPVVASLGSSVGEILGDAALLVDPYNTNEIAGAMEQILTDEGLKNKLIERGRELVKRYSWGKCGEEILKNLQ
ncbi:MAG: glycosyltransferase family 1 protein [Patescibacteria group bacterium]|nr:glycosyltransferase family 1 protein [Patescibacteria group bacterium]MDD5490978.1 glycosyltransferase family 1 protein [Patescibacteria group bacterium]